MRAHVELLTQANIAGGMSPDEARYSALRQFGHVDGLKETCRDQREGFAARVAILQRPHLMAVAGAPQSVPRTRSARAPDHGLLRQIGESGATRSHGGPGKSHLHALISAPRIGRGCHGTNTKSTSGNDLIHRRSFVKCGRFKMAAWARIRKSGSTGSSLSLRRYRRNAWPARIMAAFSATVRRLSSSHPRCPRVCEHVPRGRRAPCDRPAHILPLPGATPRWDWSFPPWPWPLDRAPKPPAAGWSMSLSYGHV